MKKYKVSICGHYMDGKVSYNGQTIKTRMLSEQLEIKYQHIDKIDTHNWKRRPLKLLIKTILSAKTSENIIILPAQRGINVFIPLFLILQKKYKFKLHYSVIGGWLPDVCKRSEKLLEKIKKINFIYVETKKMQDDLIDMGLNNVQVVPNFKNIQPLNESSLVYNEDKILKVCTFSRVMDEKGITDAIKAVVEANKYEIKYTLDIYGLIDDGYKELFNEILMSTPEFIEYKGTISPEKSVETIKNYFALLFPTKFMTEGHPGTVIDAMCAGVPIITTPWINSSVFVKPGSTGLIYEGELSKVLNEIHLRKKDFDRMKKKCLKESSKYVPSKVMKIICDNL